MQGADRGGEPYVPSSSAPIGPWVASIPVAAQIPGAGERVERVGARGTPKVAKELCPGSEC